MWASCGPCSRWFYVPFTTGEEMSRTVCPVCSAAPDAFEVRTGDTAFNVDMIDGNAMAS